MKKILKAYQKTQGNFCTTGLLPLKKESDLNAYCGPGISAVLDKITDKPEHQKKYCRLHKTIAVLSTGDAKLYPVISAKAALLSHVSGVNALPLLLDADMVSDLSSTLEQLSVNFSAYFCVGFSEKERSILKQNYKGDTPLLYDDMMEASAVVAATISAAKLLKKSKGQVKITLEGDDYLSVGILRGLVKEGFGGISLLDERGPLYKKRPNMNRQKNKLVAMEKQKKDERSRHDVLKDSDIYIHSVEGTISSKITHQLPEKAVIISLKAYSVEKKAKQTLVSSLPSQHNHITDLHIASGIISALCEGKSLGEDTQSQAITSLANIYKSPKKDRLFPGLLEKNLSAKIAKGIK